VSGRAFLCIALSLAALTSAGLLLVAGSPPGTPEKPAKQERPDRPGEAFEFRLSQWKGIHGRIPDNALMNARRQAQALARLSAPHERYAGLAAGDWTWLGPGNIGGRVRSIVIHPVQPNVWFAGSVSGGIWKTTNSGASWAPVDDFMGNLAVSSLVMHPLDPNVMYAATGEGFFNDDGIAGAGIFKSADGGTTWSQLPATAYWEFREMCRVAISSDGAVLLAATRTGLYRSTDAGASFQKALATPAGIADVDFHPTDASRAVAGGYEGNTYYTVDGGVTWLQSLTGEFLQRVEVAYARSNPSIVYAAVDVDRGALVRSLDGGMTWGGINPPGAWLQSQGWYDNAIWVDPTDPNTLIVGGIDLWLTRDAGSTWRQISQWWRAPLSAHADHHAIVEMPGFDGVSNKAVVFGNDGGVYSTNDVYAVGNDANAQAGWICNNNNLGITQFYGAAGNVTTGVIVGGTQDVGTLRYRPGDGPQALTRVFGGDGGFNAADQNDRNYFYGEYVYLKIFRSSDGGAGVDGYITGIGTSGNCKSAPYALLDACQPNPRALFIAPFILDPNNQDRLLAGGFSLWRTEDPKAPLTNWSGPMWQNIKPELRDPTTFGYGAISAIAVAQGNSDICWVGHAPSTIWKSTNCTAATPSWTKITSIPNGSPLRITIDPHNHDRVYVAYAGFWGPNLWRTDDGGVTWISASGSEYFRLPTAPVRDVKVHPLLPAWVYAATEVGIFVSEDMGATWRVPHGGPANVSTDELFWMGTALVAATHGRGLYKTRPLGPFHTASLTSNKSAPQLAGSAITFTANASGGVAPYQFKFLLFDGTKWTTVREWNTSDSFVWIPAVPNGAYKVGVWARSVNVTSDRAEGAASIPFEITPAPRVSALTLTSNLSPPQPPDTSIEFTAAATGGTAPYQFKWLRFDGTTWSVLRGWTPFHTYSWTPGQNNSRFKVGVWVRSAGNLADAAEAAQSMAFAIATPRVDSVALSSDLASPQAPNTTITFTARLTGGRAPHEYKWLIYDGSTWTTAAAWSTSAIFPWTPAVPRSAYKVGVWARSAGNVADAAEAAQSIAYPIIQPRVSAVTIAADRGAPQPPHTSITFTATASGGLEPYQYKWYVFDGVGWSIAAAWSTTATFTWTPAVPNTAFRIGVWARSAGSAADAAEAAASIGFPIVQPRVTALALTTDLTSPRPPGTTITFTAVPTGGLPPYSYKWLLFDGSGWSVAQNWTPDANTFAWTPLLANPGYKVGVWVRSSGNTADAAEVPQSVLFPIQ
jgi:hypothetical protein